MLKLDNAYENKCTSNFNNNDINYKSNTMVLKRGNRRQRLMCQTDLPAVLQSGADDFNAASCFCSWSTDLECDDLSAATVCLCTSCSAES